MPTATYSPGKSVIGMRELSRICEINLSTMTSRNAPLRNTEVTMNFISPSINDMETINHSNFNYNNFNTPILVENGYKSIEPLTASRCINRISNKKINITNIITIPKSDVNTYPLKSLAPNSNNPTSCSIITLLHLNIRSLKKRDHFIQIRNLARDKNYEVISLSETRLNSSVKNAEINIIIIIIIII